MDTITCWQVVIDAGVAHWAWWAIHATQVLASHLNDVPPCYPGTEPYLPPHFCD